jgi:hypothetical protein
MTHISFETAKQKTPFFRARVFCLLASPRLFARRPVIRVKVQLKIEV